ncbi:MAG: type II toxin-antitoxin system ParD family antitoxin, partial [Candidatus Lokiarchaeota archaeon]|nr:type II toxin-antitoxin system ParD family antitoxin [Candidatus Lokiarchaeota archaeon]
MSFNYNLESFKNKKDLIEELNYYKSIILKKIKDGDYNSALEKVRSALVLIEEHKGSFNIEKEILGFYEINKQVRDELINHKMIYERRFNNLLKEK